MPTYRGDLAFVSLLERCRELRQSSTDAESLLWKLLGSRQVAGAKFRCQHQYGWYVLDCYCDEKQVVVEVDGAHHFEAMQQAQDEELERFLQAAGLKVLRFTNCEVLAETKAVLEKIWVEVSTPSPSPSPNGGWEKPNYPPLSSFSQYT